MVMSGGNKQPIQTPGIVDTSCLLLLFRFSTVNNVYRRLAMERSLNEAILFIFVFIAVSLAPVLSFAEVYYVSPQGNDSNPGTKDLPWRTIQKAAEQLVAGDTVFIMSGSYHEQVTPRNSGRNGAYITYTTQRGETATIDGDGIRLKNYRGLFHVSGKNYIRIEGLRVINAGPHDNNAGIMVSNCSNIVIKGNHTYNTVSSGIGIWRSDTIIVPGAA